METDVHQHDDQQAAPETESWKPEDVQSTEVQKDGTVLITLKDGETKSAPVPKRVTNVEGSETLQAALALAAATKTAPDEVLRRLFSNPQPAAQPATQPDPEPETDPFAEIDKQLKEVDAALDLAIEDADGKAQKRLTRELAQLEAARATLKLQQEHAAERKQQSKTAEAAAAIQAEFDHYDQRAMEILPALGDPNSQERAAFEQAFAALTEREQNNPATAEIVALRIASQFQQQRQPGSSLRGSGFTPPGSSTRGREIRINPQQHIRNMTPEEALKLVGSL